MLIPAAPRKTADGLPGMNAIKDGKNWPEKIAIDK
jgi:hypothetical protein